MLYLRIFIVTLMLTLIGGCSVFVSAPKDVPTGKDVVVILSEGSAFKDAVVDLVAAELGKDGITVVTDDPNRARFYHAADYGAVVYFADYWMWHVPWHQKRYFNNNDNAANIIFVVTSGDPDVTIDDPFDAVTSPSEQDRVAPVSAEILHRLVTIMK